MNQQNLLLGDNIIVQSMNAAQQNECLDRIHHFKNLISAQLQRIPKFDTHSDLFSEQDLQEELVGSLRRLMIAIVVVMEIGKLYGYDLRDKKYYPEEQYLRQNRLR